MHEDSSAPTSDRPGTTLVSSAVAAVGALAMLATVPVLDDLARSSHGSEALIAQVLLGLALLGTLLCLYLALIWGLATAIVLAGPASRTGASLLGLLRILAPRLARRLAGGAAIATAAATLTLAPALATQGPPLADPAAFGSPSVQASRLVSAELPPQDAGTSTEDPTAPARTGHAPAEPAPAAAAPAGGAPGSNGQGVAPLPSLGWHGGSVPETTGTASEAVPSPAASPEAGRDVPDQDSPRTVVVEHGDSLWSISAELLGPENSDPAAVAAAWPVLHETNRDLIGEDPGLLHPGQELVVPSALTSQDMS